MHVYVLWMFTRCAFLNFPAHAHNRKSRYQQSTNRDAVNVFVTENAGKTLTPDELLAWFNEILQLDYKNIEELKSGAAYCQLVDQIYESKYASLEIVYV